MIEPVRGPHVRELGLALPPERMRLLSRGRPLKRWRWVGVFSPELMLCVGHARLGPLSHRWWAVALPDGTLRGGRRGVELAPGRVRVRGVIDLSVDEDDGIEVVSPAGSSYIWTRKQAGVPARGRVQLGGRTWDLDARTVVDDSAGYHERRTSWRWSAGVGEAGDGTPVAWNLVAGIHDAAGHSERTVWRGEQPLEVGPVQFAHDLSSVSFSEGGALSFSEWAAREDNTNLLLFRSRYRQPFGTFSGELPGGSPLGRGLGVMEEHDALW
jgi:hypothetical protein